jgi:hypothetical protein
MSGTTCPRCHGPIPEGVVRELLQGTKCPFCAASLKRSPGRAAIEVVSDASFQATPAKAPPAKPAEATTPAKPVEPPSPPPPLASVPAQKNIRSTMVGTAAAASPTRPLPFDGSPAPISFALSPPAAPPPVRAAAAPVRAAAAPTSTAPASAPPVGGGAAAAFARTIAAPAPVRTPSVRPAVAPAAGRPARSLTPAQALDLPPPTPAPVLKTPPPVVAMPLVTDNDSEPTHVAHPSARHATPPPAPVLGGGDSDPIIEAVTMTAEPAEPAAMPPPLVPAASPLHLPSRRNLPLIGIGMGVAIVAVVVGGIKLLSRPKTTAASVAAAQAKPAPEREPVAPTIEPAPAPSAPVAKAPPPVRAAKPTLTRVADALPTRSAAARPATPVRASQNGDASGTSKRRSRGGNRLQTKVAHQKHERHTRKVAMREPAAKKSAAAPSTDGSDPRPHYERGNALLFAGDGKGAVAAYREAVKLAPNDPIGFRGLGLAYEQQGETAAAIRALKRYLKLAPNAPDRALIERRIERLSHRSAGKK